MADGGRRTVGKGRSFLTIRRPPFTEINARALIAFRVHGCTPPPKVASEQQKSHFLLLATRVVTGGPIPSFD
jgi:hypothetical protein